MPSSARARTKAASAASDVRLRAAISSTIGVTDISAAAASPETSCSSAWSRATRTRWASSSTGSISRSASGTPIRSAIRLRSPNSGRRCPASIRDRYAAETSPATTDSCVNPAPRRARRSRLPSTTGSTDLLSSTSRESISPLSSEIACAAEPARPQGPEMARRTRSATHVQQWIPESTCLMILTNRVKPPDTCPDDGTGDHPRGWSPVSSVADQVSVTQVGRDLLQQFQRGLRDHGAGQEDRRRTHLLQRRYVVRRDDPTDHDHDVLAALVLERLLQRGQQRQVAGSQRGDADDVHVRVDRLLGDLLGRGEQGANVDVEAEVRERRHDDLLAPVVTVLTHLRDEDARATALVLLELRRGCQHLGGGLVVADLVLVHAGDRTDHGLVATVGLLHRVRDLSDGGLGPSSVDRELEQVAIALLGRTGDGRQGRLDGLRVALCPQALELGQLLLVDLVVVHLEHVELVLGR